MSEYTPEFCPICKLEMEDRRHVSVECFYEVNEYVPTAEKSMFFTQVDEGVGIWGHTRRYYDGTRDHHESIPTGPNSSRVEVSQVPIDPPDIRLLERQLYSLDCCKRCRHEFLMVFKMWSQGRFIEKYRTTADSMCREATKEEIEEMMRERA